MACEIFIFPDEDAVARAAAERVTALVDAAIAQSGSATLALSGGRTPRRLYETLARPPYRDRVSWHLVHWFWGDERPVPSDHPESNYRLAAETLLHQLPIDWNRVHRVPTELGPYLAAETYERELREVFGIRPGEVPQFDLILLGMGADGHVASLFPETAALRETMRLVVANDVPQLRTTRITFTAPLLQRAHHVIVLVTGDEKALAVRAALEQPYDPQRVPAHVLRSASGVVLWMLDAAAARHLTVPAGPCPEQLSDR